MRVYWQSFVDAASGASYLETLRSYLAGVASPGTEVHVSGMSPPDRDFGRLSEFRCAVQAIDAGLRAEQEGFDVFVMGHFQDPGLYELRSALGIPVVGAGEATLLAASTLGRCLGLVTLDTTFRTWHFEQADRYGIPHRMIEVAGMDCLPRDFDEAFAGHVPTRERLVENFRRCAEPLLAAGADVIIPAGVLPALLLSNSPGLRIGDAPVVNCAAVALKAAEMWAQLRTLTGLEPNRGACFKAPNERAKQDFMTLVARGASAITTKQGAESR